VFWDKPCKCKTFICFPHIHPTEWISKRSFPEQKSWMMFMCCYSCWFYCKLSVFTCLSTLASCSLKYLTMIWKLPVLIIIIITGKYSASIDKGDLYFKYNVWKLLASVRLFFFWTKVRNWYGQIFSYLRFFNNVQS